MVHLLIFISPTALVTLLMNRLIYIFIGIGGSNLNLALNLANKKMFSSEFGMRADKKKVLVLYTDGEESFRNLADPTADEELKIIKDKGTAQYHF